jgi:5-methylcytosine-specific restriction endonuclease McrA
VAYALDDEWENGRMIRQAGTAAFGLYTRCGLWIARQGPEGTDGFVPADLAADYGTREWAAKLVAAGLWEVVEGGFHDPHYLKRNPSAAQVAKRRATWTRKQALFRDPELRQAVRARDRDLCRYCGVRVRWNDRKGSGGGTYDHVDPNGPNALTNLVVCCRGCNAAKSDRTPEQAGMTLRPPPPDLDTTQNVSRSRSGYRPESQRAQGPPPKGGSGGLVEPHPYEPDGHECAHCPLPEKHPVHTRSA